MDPGRLTGGEANGPDVDLGGRPLRQVRRQQGTPLDRRRFAHATLSTVRFAPSIHEPGMLTGPRGGSYAGKTDEASVSSARARAAAPIGTTRSPRQDPAGGSAVARLPSRPRRQP